MSIVIEPKKDCEGTFDFISRHDPNDGQIALIHDLGYCDYKKTEIEFGEDPVNDLKEHGIEKKTLGIVAPTHANAKLLNEGYTIFEFQTEQSARKRGVFLCKGAYEMKLESADGLLDDYFASMSQDYPWAGAGFNSQVGKVYTGIGIKKHECPIPVEEQEESEIHVK